jgi:hypothetical protein
VSIRWSKCKNHLPDGVSPAPGTSHGFIAFAFASGVSLLLLLVVIPSARSHGFGGGGVDMFALYVYRLVFSTQSGNSIQSSPGMNSFYMMCVYITRVLLKNTPLERKKRSSSPKVDGQTPKRFSTNTHTHREREKAFNTKSFALKNGAKLLQISPQKKASLKRDEKRRKHRRRRRIKKQY